MRRHRLVALAVLGGIACASSLKPLAPRGSDAPATPAAGPVSEPIAAGGRPIGSSGLTPSLAQSGDVTLRVVVASAIVEAAFDSPTDWTIVAAGGGGMLARPRRNELFRILADRRRLRVVPSSGGMIASGSTLYLTPATRDDAIRYAGKRYRGEIAVTPTDSGLLIVNRIPVEDYLRGVVPLEIGNRPAAERAAAEAQAIAARSYAYVRVRSRRMAAFDILGTELEQLYGGVEAEKPVTDAAIAATRGLGLLYGGRLVDAPYHSTCGGSTASVSEVWHRRPDLPYLRAVSDRVPGSDQYWCSGSATFSWTRVMEGRDVDAAIGRYLRGYVSSAPAAPGRVRSVTVRGLTPSGRVRSISIATDRGRYAVSGNDMRFVLRASNGRILNSTRFSVDQDVGSDGRIARLTIRGNGNGHGIGMCQWGAIGRARAGHDARSILAAYYPGTSVARIDPADLRSTR